MEGEHDFQIFHTILFRMSSFQQNLQDMQINKEEWSVHRAEKQSIEIMREENQIFNSLGKDFKISYL